MDTPLYTNEADCTIKDLLIEYKHSNDRYQLLKDRIDENADSSQFHLVTNAINASCKILFLLKRKIELASADCKFRIATINEQINQRKDTLRERKRQRSAKRIKIFTPTDPKFSYYFQCSTRYEKDNADYNDAIECGYRCFSGSSSKLWKKTDNDKLHAAVRETIICEQSRKLVLKMDKIYDAIVETSDIRKIDGLKNTYKKLLAIQERNKNSSLENLLLDYPDFVIDWGLISARYLKERFSAEACERWWNLVAHPLFNKTSWSTVEDLYLNSLVVQHADQNWEAISEELGTGRTAFICFARYTHVFRRTDRKVPKVWTSEENAVVDKYLQRHPKNDHFYSALVPKFANVSRKRLESHLIYVKRTRNKERGKFNVKERFLVNFYSRKGYSDAKIAQKLGNRSAKQIYDFKRNADKVTSNKGWTNSELRKLLVAVKYNGVHRWTEVSKYFPNRSAIVCQRKFYRLKSQKANLIDKWMRKIPRLGEIRTMLRGRITKTRIDRKIESYFEEQAEKENKSYDGNPATLAKAVLDILKYLRFDGVPGDERLTEIGNWLVKCNDSTNFTMINQKQPFDKLFENFRPPKVDLMHHKSAKFTKLSPKTLNVVPPNKCTIYGFDTVKKKFAENYQNSGNTNFEQLWVNIDSKFGKDREFIKAKILLYETMKALFYWPLKLDTIPVAPELL